MSDELKELARRLSHERDPGKRRELKEKIMELQEKELRKKSGW